MARLSRPKKFVSLSTYLQPPHPVEDEIDRECDRVDLAVYIARYASRY